MSPGIGGEVPAQLRVIIPSPRGRARYDVCARCSRRCTLSRRRSRSPGSWWASTRRSRAPPSHRDTVVQHGLVDSAGGSPAHRRNRDQPGASKLSRRRAVHCSLSGHTCLSARGPLRISPVAALAALPEPVLSDVHHALWHPDSRLASPAVLEARFDAGHRVVPLSA
jgi:hypothetical protein